MSMTRAYIMMMDFTNTNCRVGRKKKKIQKKILQYIHFWCEIDQKQFMNERRSSKSKRGVAIPYHQSTLCPDVHFRVSPISKNVKKFYLCRKKSKKIGKSRKKNLGLENFRIYILVCPLFPKKNVKNVYFSEEV